MTKILYLAHVNVTEPKEVLYGIPHMEESKGGVGVLSLIAEASAEGGGYSPV